MKNVKPKSALKPAKAKPATTGRARSKPKTAYSQAEIEEIFRRFSIQRPKPKGELEHVNPFTLVVAVALSAQATDAGVNKATRALFAIADTPEKMVALGEDQVRDYIRTIGLYRNKAKNVIALSEKLIAEFGGEVPRTREDLITLPGVGRKTANVVLSMAFGQATMAVDTHIFRIANRALSGTGQDPGRSRTQADADHSRSLSLSSASLADPARALLLQGPQTGMPALRDCRHLQGGRKKPARYRHRWSNCRPRSFDRDSVNEGSDSAFVVLALRTRFDGQSGTVEGGGQEVGEDIQQRQIFSACSKKI